MSKNTRRLASILSCVALATVSLAAFAQSPDPRTRAREMITLVDKLTPYAIEKLTPSRAAQIVSDTEGAMRMLLEPNLERIEEKVKTGMSPQEAIRAVGTELGLGRFWSLDFQDKLLMLGRVSR